MNHEQFRKTFESMGFDVSVDQEPPEGEDLGVLVAENDDGDQIFWSIINDREVWGLYFDLDRFTLDNATRRWRDVEELDDGIRIESATGTRNVQYGYGRAGFDGTLDVRASGSQVTEVHTY